ncbi:MAG TPA: DUF2934 domain-containing protein [Bryobacteraceae bacterium]|jgi:hypothetical protein
MNQPTPSAAEIETRAYHLWEARGRPFGTPETDWFEAERELSDGAPDGILTKVAREVGTVIGHAAALVADLDPRKHRSASDETAD